jgi:prepilin-type N-terminal cleavage/methylation domain-containing protein
MKKPRRYSLQEGFTLVELTVTLVAFAIIAISFMGLFTSLVKSTVVARKQAVATTLATSQMEYLKSLPYDSLAVTGGSIYATVTIPPTKTQILNGVKYTITTSINYVDDAYDGCANYGSVAQTQIYCRNYPAPTGSPNPDTNPKDYKIAHVSVTDTANTTLAQVDTQISSRVSETASTTGALFATIIDNNGNKISGATVTVTNTTVTPNVNVSDSTDSNGTAIFYGLPPDTNNFDFTVTATKNGYSSLSTIVQSGALQPTYPNQKIFTQQSSYLTLTLKPQGVNSLVIETTDTNGNSLAGVKVYIKGGYKKYTSTTDKSYYYDTMSPTDTRPITSASGSVAVQNLVPGGYYFCGDVGATSCVIGGTTYYLAAAVPYGGTSPFSPVDVPTYLAASPPTITFDYSGTPYLQKVRLILTTSSAFPRIINVNPSNVSLSGGTLDAFTFTINGVNLPCTASGSGCGTTVSIKQDTNTYVATCTGTSAGLQLNCTVDMSGVAVGNTQLVVTSGSNTLTLPGGSLIGGIVVNP